MDNIIDIYIKEVLEETIKKNNNKYCLISKKRKNLGCYRSKKSAKKREKQVNYFKHIKKEEELDEMSTAVGLVGAVGKRYREEDQNE